MEILLSHLKKTFGETIAVDIPHLAVHSGDMLGLVGNNGAGKTTLFRLMLDLVEATEGSVKMTFDDSASDGQAPFLENGGHADATTVDPTLSEAWKQYTGAYINEGFLIDFLTPEEYLDFVAKVNGMPAGNRDALADTMPVRQLILQFAGGELFGKKKLIRNFSAGNKQKIGIIAALYARPQLLILDEPFNFLDPSSQNLLKRILTTYHDETGATILVSSHNLQHTVDISTRIVLLEHGRILNDLSNADGAARDALEDYFKI